MRKALWIVLALLVVGAAQVARADSFDYKVTDLTTGATATFAESSLATSGDVTSFLSVTGGIQEFVWNSAADATCLMNSFPGEACAGVGYASSDLDANFAPGSFLSSGTYQGFNGVGGSLNTITVTITEVSGVPEPSSLMLLGSGLLAVAGIKRRRC